MTLLDIQERLQSLSNLPANWDQQQADPPTHQALHDAWLFAIHAIKTYQFNPTDCVPSKDGGVALVWLHPINRDRYGDLEVNNDGNVVACLSSKAKEILEEWQISGHGVPVIGERQRTLDESLQRLKSFLQNGLVS